MADETERFDAFVAALKALCIAHGVMLATSGYDGLDVWPLESGEEPIHANGIENRLGERRA